MKKARETKTNYAVRSERTISIPESVMNDLNELIKLEGAPIEEVLNRAVTHYRGELGHRKIIAEAEAYRRKHLRLRTKYLGEYIAMHNGHVVDHDRDLAALNRRIRARYGSTPVLMRLVEQVVEREIIVRSPRYACAGCRSVAVSPG